MVIIFSMIAVGFAIGLFIIFYRTEKKKPNDIYLWVGQGEDPFRNNKEL